ncbi:hypothetical protein [Streptomyces sp. SID13031]|uniref:hypothetical protein n=1 Tax=Streptomyces sp. SID13031 TaxID=2706046 RepID=UPI0013CDC083|nr:hypothetical protein [Streptomyces sp. SID13031]NEA31609.1 hypothetical protein [Streptomyces sp. SID13031]
MTGSHRAPRGGSRADAREARRQQSRRRNQLIGAGAAVVLLVGGGGIAAVNAFGGSDSPGDAKNSDGGSGGDDSSLLGDAAVLLDGTAVKQLAPAAGAWVVASTDNGSNAPDKAFVCQSQRFADPAGIRTWIRTFQNPSTKATAVQYVEVSNDEAAAGKAYATITGWLSACNTPQLRLISSYTTDGLGSKGVVAVFGQPGPKTNKYRTISVSTAGQTTMVVEYDTAGTTPPKPDTMLATAGAGLKRICAQAKCTTGTPTAKPGLLPTTEPAGFMAPIDLPVLPSIDNPWVSTSSAAPKGSGCETDKLDVKKAKPKSSKSQTYVVPEAKVPPEFGLDTLVVAFASPNAAANYVAAIRKAVDNCKKTQSNATVKATGDIAVGSSIRGESWRASYDTGNGKIFTYRVGIAAAGSRAVYVLYPVLKDLDITNPAFNEVLTRAAERSAAYK